eukprot:6203848-Pleurochrysis_carterae.AAC.1
MDDSYLPLSKIFQKVAEHCVWPLMKVRHKRSQEIRQFLRRIEAMLLKASSRKPENCQLYCSTWHYACVR